MRCSRALYAGTQLGVLHQKRGAIIRSECGIGADKVGSPTCNYYRMLESPVHHKMPIFIALYALSADALQLQLTLNALRPTHQTRRATD